jgi:hypothetical protein
MMRLAVPSPGELEEYLAMSVSPSDIVASLPMGLFPNIKYSLKIL